MTRMQKFPVIATFLFVLAMGYSPLFAFGVIIAIALFNLIVYIIMDTFKKK